MKRLSVFSGCTEFGSEVQAFRDRGHNVTTLGIEGDVDIQCDIRQYFPSVDDHYDFVSLHPPCTEFSIADWRKGACKDRTPDMSIVWACFRIIDTLKPRYWMIENPRGCLRHFIGRPQYSIKYGDFGHYCLKPTDLWGVLPFLAQMRRDTHAVCERGRSGFMNDKNIKNLTAYETGKSRAAIRSIVPYSLSLALCLAVEDALG